MKRIQNKWAGAEGYHCFACAPHNPYGLHLEFYVDGDELVTFWKPAQNYQSWVNVIHGGIQSVMIDEAAGWAINHFMQVACVTARFNLTYRRPVNLDGGPIEVRCRIRPDEGRFTTVDCQLIQRGKVCTQAEAIYATFSKERSESDFKFTGTTLEEGEVTREEAIARLDEPRINWKQF